MTRQPHLAALGLLVVVNLARAQTAATLGEPRPAASLSGTVRPVVRASPPEQVEGGPIVSLEVPEPDPWKKEVPAPKATDYPPTYSSNRREVMPKAFTDLWKKNSSKEATSATSPGGEKQTYRDPRHSTPEKDKQDKAEPQEKIKPNESLPSPKRDPDDKPTIRGTPLVLPTNSAVPAWRWYGYGNITPYNGVGSFVTPVGWLKENCPVPQGIGVPTAAREMKSEVPARFDETVTVLVPREELPRIEPPPVRGIPFPPVVENEPVAVEVKKPEPPKDDFVLPPPLPPTGTPIGTPVGMPITQRDARGGTTIYFPTPQTQPKASFGGTVTPRTLPPTSMRSGPYDRTADARVLARGQAPSQPENIVNSFALAPKLERAAKGAKEVHVHLSKSNHIGIRLVVPPGVDFEAIADRIGAIPELSKFYLDFDVTVR